VIYNLTSYKSLLALSAAVCAFAFAGGVEAKAKFKTFDPPNTLEIHVIGISNAGVIGGYYNDGSATHGFLRAVDKSFTYIDPPGSQETLIYGMNNSGATVGFYDAPNGCGICAIVRSTTGKFHDIVINNGAVAYAISDANVVVGNYEDAVTGAQPAFIRDARGNVSSFNVTGNTGGTHPAGINADGVIAGWYANSDQVSHGFVRNAGGKITTIDYPGGATTFAVAINIAGAITGYYSDGTYFHGFIRSPDGATITPIDVPDDVGGTVPTCINSNGDIAGYYAAQSGGAWLGFVRTAAGKFSTINPQNSQYTTPAGINKMRTIAGATSIGGLNWGFVQGK